MERLKIGQIRLEIDAVPTLFVKYPSDGPFRGISRANIDVEAVSHLPQRPPQHYIFLVLREGDK
jgi:hypothetical protein